MAIQDDNTILNKGDLKAYHEAIAPMLGGTFMVRTNNSDYYSTDEKVIGVWTDGKPLYQKTIEEDVTLDSDSWVSSIDVSSFNIDNIINAVGHSNTLKGSLSIDTKIMSNTLYIFTSDLGGIVVNRITLQYTKTTDTAGSATTTPGAYDINFPNIWPENTEIYFGNGLYGKRMVGSRGATTNQDFIVVCDGNVDLISYGGWISWSEWVKAQIGMRWGNEYGSSFMILSNQLNLGIQHPISNTTTYDFWITYTK